MLSSTIGSNSLSVLDESLRRQTAEAFRALGLVVDDTDEGGRDLLVSHGDLTAVVETKGVKKSASGAHARQLENWVSDHPVDQGEAKGILLINTYRETPIQERTEPRVPQDVLDYSQPRGHCLLSGLQLLGLALEAKSEPAKVDILVDELFDTAGEFARYRDPADILESFGS